MKYDVIIIGAGPAGVSASYKLSNKLSTLIIDEGKGISRKRNLTSGWFGRGLFELNDIKLNNDKECNYILEELKNVARPSKPIIKKKFCSFPLLAGPAIANFYLNKIGKTADILFNTKVYNIRKENDLFIVTTSKKEYVGKKCIIATGSNSLVWSKKICKSAGIYSKTPTIKVGVRVEIPTRILNCLTDDHNVNYSDIRPNAFVGEWEDSRFVSAFSHGLPEERSEKTNFTIGKNYEETNSIIRTIKIVNVLANDKIKREKVYNYLSGNSILKHIGLFSNLKETFLKIDEEISNFIDFAFMYIPELKYSGIIKVDEKMKTNIDGLYCIGEASIKAETIIGAMASGRIAAKGILGE